MDEQEQPLTAHQRYWLERVKACNDTGMSAVAHASEHGLPFERCMTRRKFWSGKAYCRGRSAARFNAYTQTRFRSIANGVCSDRTACQRSFPARSMSDHHRRY